MAINIEILVVPNCPNGHEAYRSCERATTGIPHATIIITEIHDAASAQRSGMRSSPTILINGHNPFDDTDSPTSFACRIGPDAIPTDDQIAAAAVTSDRR